MATLRSTITALRVAGGHEQITRAMRRELLNSQRPFAPRVRAAVLNTPAYGRKHTGLRGRIAGCVQTWVVIKGDLVSAGVEVDASRMPDGQKALPLYLDGAKAPWRHPLFGDRSRWYSQASHPFFAEATALYGPASANAVRRAADRVTAAFDQLAG